MQWSADNLDPTCQAVNKRCFDSIQTGIKNRIDAQYVDKIFTFVSSCFIDLLVKS